MSDILTTLLDPLTNDQGLRFRCSCSWDEMELLRERFTQLQTQSQKHDTDVTLPDVIEYYATQATPEGHPVTIATEGGQTHEARATEITFTLQFPIVMWERDGNLIYWAGDGITGAIPGLLLIGKEPPEWRAFADALNARNRRLGVPHPLKQPKSKRALAAWTQPKPLKADSYPIQTGQEVDALSRAASDGRTNRNWKRDDQCSALVHYAPGHSHYVQVPLMPEEVSDGAAIDALERLVRDMDADCVFAILYVWRLLLPPIPLPPNQYASVWIDLDDVASRVWPRRPKNAQERRERRKRVYDYLLFVARTRVVGRRSGVYRDKDTGKELSTSVGTPLWAIGRLEWLDGAFALDPISPESLPVRMELVCTDEWKRLAANPNTCQYLPYGELLGGIPGDRVTGAWARVIGLALANHWRRNPRETLAGMRWPTRRELLQRFTPKLAPSHEVMEGPHPMRAITYWHGALQELCNRGFLAREGEAARKIAEMKNVGSRYGWQDKWLDEHVDLRPGPKERPHLEQLASAMPMLRPRELSPAKRPRTARKKP